MISGPGIVLNRYIYGGGVVMGGASTLKHQ